MSDRPPQPAKQYETFQHLLFLAETLYTVILLVVFLVSGASARLATFVSHPWLATTIYAAAGIIGMKLAFLPLNWLGGFFLEHRYKLSNQTVGAWLWDEVKSLGLSLVLGVTVFDLMYWLLRVMGPWWWVAVGCFFLLFGVVLSALFPVLILPIFYKLKPLENESLTRKLSELAGRVGIKIVGVYRMGMSEKTRKANAAFAGLGATKRIILGDTLLEGFAEDEIEVVMAHEMAHYLHRDIWRLIGWSALTIFAGLWLTDAALRWLLPSFGFHAASELAAFPLLALCLFAFGLVTMPLNNAFSRWRERLADRTALELTRNPDGFIRAMRKLAEQNLADVSPHPLIEFLLHDHPSLARRISWAEQWQPG